MSRSVQAVLWTVGGLTVVACLLFLAIFVKFVTKAALGYIRHKPYAATATFGVPGGLGSFIAAWFGAPIPAAMVIGLICGLALFLLIAVETGSD